MMMRIKPVGLAESSKRVIRYFLSYAHADERDVKKFLTVFEPMLALSPNYDYQLWSDQSLRPGELWDLTIKTALSDCEFGLLLLSPNFLASNYVAKVELPTLLLKSILVPVGLHELPLSGTANLRGLEARQIFLENGKAFDDRRWASRRKFAQVLYQQVENLLLAALPVALFSEPSRPPSSSSLGASIQAMLVHEPGSAPQNIIETGVPFQVHTRFTINGPGVLIMGGGVFKVDVSFEGLGAAALEVDLPTVTVSDLSGGLTFPLGVPTRTYDVISFVPGTTLPKGAYEMISVITHEVVGIPSPIAGYSDEQIIQVFPNTLATTP